MNLLLESQEEKGQDEDKQNDADIYLNKIPNRTEDIQPGVL